MQNTGWAAWGGPPNQYSGGPDMIFKRSRLLAAAPAAAAATVFSAPTFAQGTPAAAPPATGSQQAPGFYRYKVGDIEATAINDGVWMRPLDAGFVKNAQLDEVKKAQEQVFLPTEV